MRIMVYKQELGKRRVVVLPRRRSGLAPVSLRGVTREHLQETVSPIIDQVARQEATQPALQMEF